jgi:hypothetical protein
MQGPLYPSLSGHDVAAFLGRADDEQLVAMAARHLFEIAQLARSYTRGSGFLIQDSDNAVVFTPNAEIASVIVLATARLVTNPAQVQREEADGYAVAGSFQGWTLPERAVLDRYRR